MVIALMCLCYHSLLFPCYHVCCTCLCLGYLTISGTLSSEFKFHFLYHHHRMILTIKDNIFTDRYLHGDVNRFPNASDNNFMSDTNSFGYQSFPKEGSMSFSTASESSRLLDPRLESSKKSMGSISALKELVRFQ